MLMPCAITVRVANSMGVPEMSDDLNQLVRATYNNAMLVQRDSAVAFERAVQVVQRRRPLLAPAEARKEVAVMLAVEPTEPAAGS
jgi:hypothetical protein